MPSASLGPSPGSTAEVAAPPAPDAAPFGESSARAGGSWSTDRTTFLAAPVDPAHLAHAIAAGSTLVVEPLGDDAALAAALNAMTAAAQSIISLGTTTAYHLPLADAVADLVERRAGRPLPVHDALTTAVHEAIANAILHGNLEMPGLAHDGTVALADYFAELQRRLAEPTLARRRITIAVGWDAATVRVSVLDSGIGFAHDRVVRGLGRAARPVVAGGRGLLLMRALADGVEYGRGGREVSLRFARGSTPSRRHRP